MTYERKVTSYEIEWFMWRMEEKMRDNEDDPDKGGWDDIDPHFALMRMRQEVEELAPLVERFDEYRDGAADIVRECADVANFAYMLANVARRWEDA